LVQIVQFDLQGAKKISPFNPEFLFKKAFRVLADMKDSNCLITTSKDTLQLLTPAGLLTNIQKEFSGRVLWN